MSFACHSCNQLIKVRRLSAIHLQDISSIIGQDGGAKEDRTPDLLRARQALSQLSYGPVRTRSGGSRWT